MSQITKRALEQSLKNLLLKKPLTKITVGDIADDCGINRMTFYYHFKDMPALLDEIVRSKIDSILSEYYCDDAPEQCMHKALDMLSENRRAVLHVYSSAARDVFDQCLSHACEYWADRFIEHYAAGRELDYDTRAFMTYMCRFNCSGLLSDWFIRGMKPEAEPAMHRACTLWAEAAELAHRGAR